MVQSLGNKKRELLRSAIYDVTNAPINQPRHEVFPIVATIIKYSVSLCSVRGHHVLGPSGYSIDEKYQSKFNRPVFRQ